MTLLKSVVLFFLLIILISCNKENKSNTEVSSKEITENSQNTKAQMLLNETISAHGGTLYNSAHYSFTFRGKNYQFKNEGNSYEYIKSLKKGETTIKDVLKNDVFIRTINKNPVTLNDKEIVSGTGSINSVIYFATLPYKLNDKAVNSKYIQSTIIKNKKYDVIEITFNEEGGGEDHDDVFYYWINKDSKKIDYLAYSYKVNEGGVRFRSAYNRSVINGITFQDYINYEAKIGTALKDLPKLYESEKLKELSRIETKNIINLNNN